MHAKAKNQDGPHYYQPEWVAITSEHLKVDLCIYGGTSASITAAIEATKRGRSVIILNPARRVGGMTTGGLGWTDFGKKDVVGGMARTFYDAVEAHYKKETWMFEPHVAQDILDGWLKDHRIDVRHGAFLDKVVMDGKKIRTIVMRGGLTVEARVFIDATYEGDLMARAGVPFFVGRESNHTYNETLNGSQVRHVHQFSSPVDPYVIPGDPASGLLHGIEPGERQPDGQGDHRIQAYCFRVCLTDNDDIRIPFPKPQGYDPATHELLIRWFNSEKDRYNESLLPTGEIRKFDRLAVKYKTDTNNHGPVSSDYIGQNFDWPAASYEERQAIHQKHVLYQQGLYYTLANDPRMPERYRNAYAKWGLAGDEFVDTNNWPDQLYVREARRMIADVMLTEHDCMHTHTVEDPVGMGSYTMDSHNCRRFVKDGRVLNDGDVQVATQGAYGVSYRSVVPPRGSCTNLLVPVCLGASHIAYGSVRMEPVFLVLGQSVAIAADLALRNKQAVQDLRYDELQPELLDAKQVLQAPPTATA